MKPNLIEAVLRKGQKLYEDNDYLFLWTKFFGISLLALTSYYVYDKHKKTITRLYGREKNYLVTLTYYLTSQHKVDGRSVIDNTSLFRDISLAILDRGGESYKLFFQQNTQDKAKFYADQAYRKRGKKTNV